MNVRTTIAAAMLSAFSTGVWANHCPLDMKAIDEALAAKPVLTTAQMDEVTRLRAEGETLHKAGKHKESVQALGKARKILGI